MGGGLENVGRVGVLIPALHELPQVVLGGVHVLDGWLGASRQPRVVEAVSSRHPLAGKRDKDSISNGVGLGVR